MTRPRQETSDDLVAGLLGIVRGQFCGGLSDKEWFQHSNFIRVKVVLWPARFITSKGFTLPPARYEKIMREIFTGIKQNGQTGSVRYWPGYLMMCVQDHWRHHWEDYYKEAKAVRSIAEAALVGCKAVKSEDRTVEALAIAHRVLAGSKRASKAVRNDQLKLL